MNCIASDLINGVDVSRLSKFCLDRLSNLECLVFRRKKHSRKDEVVNPFEVRMVMSDVQSPAHTLLPISPSENEHSDRQALMPDVVGYEHPGESFISC